MGVAQRLLRFAEFKRFVSCAAVKMYLLTQMGRLLQTAAGWIAKD